MVVSSHTRSSMGCITTTEGRREALFSADGESSQYGHCRHSNRPCSLTTLRRTPAATSAAAPAHVWRRPASGHPPSHMSRPGSIRELPDHPASVLVVIVVVISVVVMAIVVPIVFLAEFPCGAIVGVARQNIARGSLRDQPVRVLLEQEARSHVALSRIPHHAVVPLLAAVALLDRATRIAARQPRG